MKVGIYGAMCGQIIVLEAIRVVGKHVKFCNPTLFHLECEKHIVPG